MSWIVKDLMQGFQDKVRFVGEPSDAGCIVSEIRQRTICALKLFGVIFSMLHQRDDFSR